MITHQFYIVGSSEDIFRQPPVNKCLPLESGYITFQFLLHEIIPTGYMYRNGGALGGSLTSWTLEGAQNQNGPWTVLDRVEDNQTYLNDGTIVPYG